MDHTHTVEDDVTIVYPTSSRVMTASYVLAASSVCDLYMVFICRKSQLLITSSSAQKTLKITGTSAEQV